MRKQHEKDCSSAGVAGGAAGGQRRLIDSRSITKEQVEEEEKEEEEKEQDEQDELDECEEEAL